MRLADKRWVLIVLAAVVVGGIVSFRIAIGVLKGKVEDALGQDSAVEDIRVTWSGVVVEGLRIKGARGWPAADCLRAQRILIVPDLRSLFSDQFRVSSIAIDQPYVSALRARDGQLQVVPGLIARSSAKKPARGSATAPAAVIIGRFVLRDGVVEFFDATVQQPPLRIQLEQIQITVSDVAVPALTGKTKFELSGVIKSAQRDGKVNIAGWVDIAGEESSVKSTLRSVDLVALQPYLIKTSETGVRKGTLDLDLQADVRKKQLNAPGRITLSNLELAPAAGAWNTFMGMPRSAVIGFLKNQDGRIALNFTLEGDIGNPQFSLNEALATRIASSMAETLGVSIMGVAKSAGTLGQRGVEAAGDAAKGVGEALGRLFGDKPKEEKKPQ